MQPFSHLMQQWLYGKEGYYQNHKIGKDGDFYTSVSVSPFFGYCIANFIADFFTKLPPLQKIAIVEIGADKGYLISDIANFLAHNPLFAKLSFHTLEPLKNLQTTQKSTFYSKTSQTLHTLDSPKDLQAQNYDFTFFISNELLDSFACELYYKGEMAYLQDNSLLFAPAPKEIIEIAQAMELEIGEIPLHLKSFLASLTQYTPSFAFIAFDYGDLKARNAFSLRFYQNHTTNNLFLNPTSKDYYPNFLESFGKSDITYEVHFGYLKNLFKAMNAKELFFGRQNKILVDMGLDKVGEWYIQNFGLESFMHHSPKIRTLIDPAFLGERFFGIGFARI
ncbi:SAM-dependent methyltransferase [Helicobacter pullorum]|uniref:SAM-dependent methyltransferase n=1 Tax=Helicobacter pullorum TaxID=35818 RepID=UPI0006CDC4DD|nr:SAM-dependent methyltransferase [Helicobacter pullorum]KPH50818.1 hypothetical protein HPU229254_08805 [Helicobacter pullorum]